MRLSHQEREIPIPRKSLVTRSSEIPAFFLLKDRVDSARGCSR